jgi:1-acyl-sn-glycerol-3-phosphate acyltransferase
MIDNYERFDMNRPPKKQAFYWKVLIWALSFTVARMHGSKLDKSEMPKKLKPPYLVLSNHNAFLDYTVLTKGIFPHGANYVVSIDGFNGFFLMEWVLRSVGGICTRKFSRNLYVVKNMFRASKKGRVIVLYPEARYSLCGTQAVLPDSLGKIILKLNIPVVMLICHGHHINSPFWNVGSRGVKPVEAKMKLLYSKDDLKNLSVEQINQELAQAIVYDDYAWQKEKGIRVKYKKRAEGLHKVLYQCPSCLVEYQMTSSGHKLQCTACSKVWEMTELGELKAKTGETEFSHIPDWYEWERLNVRKEVEEETYFFESSVRIESLPNAKGFVVFPEPAHLTHSMEGFHLVGVSKQGHKIDLKWPVPALYSCHIEYNFKKRGDCVDLNTSDDTLYMFPSRKDFSVTKIALATEELYQRYERLEKARKINN